MRLSKQHKQILLILLRNNPTALKFSEIVLPVRKLRMKKWESTEEGKFPRPRVLSASFSRSLKTLLERGLVSKEHREKIFSDGSDQMYTEGSERPSTRWRLTTEGQAIAIEIKRELDRQIEELNEFRYFL